MDAQRAVVDTNVLVSALLSPDGNPAVVAEAVRTLRLTPIVSRAILAEYETVLRKPRFRFPVVIVDELLASLRDLAVCVEPDSVPRHPGLPDPSDWPFIAAALFAGCPIITGNTRHFPAAAGVEVLTPGAWVARVMQNK